MAAQLLCWDEDRREAACSNASQPFFIVIDLDALGLESESAEHLQRLIPGRSMFSGAQRNQRAWATRRGRPAERAPESRRPGTGRAPRFAGERRQVRLLLKRTSGVLGDEVATVFASADMMPAMRRTARRSRWLRKCCRRRLRGVSIDGANSRWAGSRALAMPGSRSGTPAAASSRFTLSWIKTALPLRLDVDAAVARGRVL